MKQAFKAILIIAITSGILAMLVTWWIAAAVAFVVAIHMQLKAGKGFVAGFFGIALMWLAMVLVKDIPNQHILSARMAGLLGLPNYGLFILVTIVLGGLTGGLFGWSGAHMNSAFRK